MKDGYKRRVETWWCAIKLHWLHGAKAETQLEDNWRWEGGCLRAKRSIATYWRSRRWHSALCVGSPLLVFRACMNRDLVLLTIIITSWIEFQELTTINAGAAPSVLPSVETQSYCIHEPLTFTSVSSDSSQFCHASASAGYSLSRESLCTYSGSGKKWKKWGFLRT